MTLNEIIVRSECNYLEQIVKSKKQYKICIFALQN